MLRILTNCALFDDCLIIPFHFCCISNSTTPSSFPLRATFVSVLPVSPLQTSGHVWFLLAEHGFGSTCLSQSFSSSKAVCLLFSFSWTCGSLIPVTFLFLWPVFQCRLFLLQIIQRESRETRSSTCHLHECTDPTLNSVAWGNLHEDFVQLFSPWQYEQCERHAWSARRCQTYLSLSVSLQSCSTGRTGFWPPRTPTTAMALSASVTLQNVIFRH